MPIAALLFLAGNLLLQSMPVLPGAAWLWLLIPFLLVLTARCWRLIFWLPAGFLCAWLAAATGLFHRLPAHPRQFDAILQGRITSLPHHYADASRFRFDVLDSDPPLKLRSVELTWRTPTSLVHAGQTWRFQVRLRTPHGWRNPGGRDRELRYFNAGVDALGSVAGGRLEHASARAACLTCIREYLAEQMARMLADPNSRALLQALVVGDRRSMTDRQWSVLRRTGTSHLFSISGLHIGLVAGFGVFLGMWLSGGFPRLQRRWSKRRLGVLLGMLLATAYAGLAGFSLPTRRALIMLYSVGAGIALRRVSASWHSLALALLLVQIADPMAVLSAGFWLSFGAVAIIFWLLDGRGGWRSTLRMQLILPLALVPMTVVLFGRVSLLSPLANLLAIPWVSVLVVPEALLGALLIPISSSAAQVVLRLAADSLAGLFWVLEHLSAWPQAVTTLARSATWSAVLAVLGVLWLVAPVAKRWRWPAVVLMVPLFSMGPDRPSDGGWELVSIDVGQGLSVLVRTHNHSLLYDTGPSFHGGGDAVRGAILPVLNDLGVRHLDRLIVSHGDADHSGGLDSLLTALPVTQTEGSDPQHRNGGSACVSGQSWQWDGVRFSFLHPPAGLPYLRNESSCVLLIRSPAGSALLPGDIGSWVERDLVARFGEALRSDVLVVPHHGSGFSSSAEFIQTVHPQLAVLSAGWNNRFHMPRPDVVARYRASGVRLLDSGQRGAIMVQAVDGQGISWRTQRGIAPHYWSVGSPGRRGFSSNRE